jgi:uncharacterized protein
VTARVLPVLLTATLLCAALAARAELAVPPLTARVTDLTNTLSPGQRDTLERRLAEFEKRKGSQIAILLVPSTAPEAIEQYSIRVADAWKLGRKGIADGALLLVAKNDRKLRIEIGRGLEGILPDVTAKRIIDDTMVPYFRKGDFYGGIDAGVSQLILVIDGEPLPAPVAAGRGMRTWDQLLNLAPLLFIAIFVAAGFLRMFLGRLIAASVTGGAVGLIAWAMTGWIVAAIAAALTLVLVLAASVTIGRGSRGIWSNSGGWSSGSFGGGSSGGDSGGFSGGGGDFGGGGASGSW